MTTDYDERTVDELRDELRDRDLKVSGAKDELVQRLEEHDADPDQPSSSRPGMREVIARIRDELAEVTGLAVERASGLTRDDSGWTAQVEVVEMSRVPPTTDVLATYRVRADDDGGVAGFERVHRYRRSDAQ